MSLYPNEVSSCCFPRKLVSFDQWHVTRSPPIRKCIWVGRYTNRLWFRIDASLTSVFRPCYRPKHWAHHSWAEHLLFVSVWAGDYPLTKKSEELQYYLMSPKQRITQENCVNCSWKYAKRGGETNHLQAVIPQRHLNLPSSALRFQLPVCTNFPDIRELEQATTATTAKNFERKGSLCNVEIYQSKYCVHNDCFSCSSSVFLHCVAEQRQALMSRWFHVFPMFIYALF